MAYGIMPSEGYPFKRIYCREHIGGTSANLIVRATSRDPRIHAAAPEIAHAWPRDNHRRGRLDRADVGAADRLGVSRDVWAGDVAGGEVRGHQNGRLSIRGVQRRTRRVW